eukprot:jgi/Botrbrau1/712/Bobra.160_2s0035.1
MNDEGTSHAHSAWDKTTWSFLILCIILPQGYSLPVLRKNDAWDPKVVVADLSSKLPSKEAGIEVVPLPPGTGYVPWKQSVILQAPRKPTEKYPLSLRPKKPLYEAGPPSSSFTAHTAAGTPASQSQSTSASQPTSDTAQQASAPEPLVQDGVPRQGPDAASQSKSASASQATSDTAQQGSAPESLVQDGVPQQGAAAASGKPVVQGPRWRTQLGGPCGGDCEGDCGVGRSCRGESAVQHEAAVPERAEVPEGTAMQHGAPTLTAGGGAPELVTSCPTPLILGCCGDGICDAAENCSTCPQDCKQRDGSPCPRVGVLFSVWHWPAQYAVNVTAQLNKTFVNVEQVIRSQTIPPATPHYYLDDVYVRNRLEMVAVGLYWMHKPQSGYSCLYHARDPSNVNFNAASQNAYAVGGYMLKNVPDCADWRGVARYHAKMLMDAGIDFVVVDLTNQPLYNLLTDGMALRPFEVLLEEWALMRKQGMRTPDIAPWQRMPSKAHGRAARYIQQQQLDVQLCTSGYERAGASAVVMRDSSTGNKLFFYADLDDDMDLLEEVASNGGQDDVTPVPMWVSWGCGQRGLVLHVALRASYWRYGRYKGGPCRQPYVNATAGTQGAQVAVSPSYQQGFASWPWGASGQLGGWMLRSQFGRAFEVQPKYVFISGWNEHVAQPFQRTDLQRALGLENDPTLNFRHYVDIYGTGYSRDIEPTEEGGDFLYRITASCIRVFRSGASSCEDRSELCCQDTHFDKIWTYFGKKIASSIFGLYSQYLNGSESNILSHRALYWCGRAGGQLFSLDGDCDTGKDTRGRFIGHVATEKGADMLRSLWLCRNGSQVSGSSGMTYTLSGNCWNVGLTNDMFVGYVR